MGDSAKRARRKAKVSGTEGGVTEPRPPTTLLAFRVPPAMAERLDALAAALSTPWHQMKRSELARVAMERGLLALEEEAARSRQRDEDVG
jgi:hypothetical protein